MMMMMMKQPQVMTSTQSRAVVNDEPIVTLHLHVVENWPQHHALPLRDILGKETRIHHHQRILHQKVMNRRMKSTRMKKKMQMLMLMMLQTISAELKTYPSVIDLCQASQIDFAWKKPTEFQEVCTAREKNEQKLIQKRQIYFLTPYWLEKIGIVRISKFSQQNQALLENVSFWIDIPGK